MLFAVIVRVQLTLVCPKTCDYIFLLSEARKLFYEDKVGISKWLPAQESKY